MIKAILFGSIGTLIETSELQRKAFNEAFKEADLKWYWDEKDYKNLLKKSGGMKRIEEFAKKENTNVNASKIRSRKTELFNEYLDVEELRPRKGIEEVINYAKEKSIKLGFVTSTSINNINAVFKTLKNFIQKENFDFIGNNNLIKKSKPDSEIYLKALKALSLEASECIAIEDTEESVKSAVSANIKCIGFPGKYHELDSFNQCYIKLNELDISIFK